MDFFEYLNYNAPSRTLNFSNLDSIIQLKLKYCFLAKLIMYFIIYLFLEIKVSKL